jgi:hypothetical protein
VPDAYIELLLCRDIYHCTPNELDEQPLDTLLLHLELVRVEQKVNRFKQGR